MEEVKILVNAISLLINLGLAYFAVKLLIAFKGGKLEKAWLPISLGALTLATSSTIFLLHYLLPPGELLRIAGGAVMMVGGALLLTGLYLEYKLWVKKRL